MPYIIKKVKNGYKVANKETGKTYSKKPMTKEQAKKQMAAMYANMNESYEYENGNYIIRVNGWVGQVEEHKDEDKIYYTYSIVNPNGEYEQISKELDKHFGGAFRPNFQNIKDYLEKKSMTEDKFKKDLKVILEAIDEQDPLSVLNESRGWQEVADIQLDEYQDKKMFGDKMFSITCKIGANYNQGDPGVYRDRDGSGYPGTPASIDWEVMEVMSVTGENGEISLTPNLAAKFKESLNNTLSDEQVAENMDQLFDAGTGGLMVRFAWLALSMVISGMLFLLINSVLQGRWGITLGKWICGIRTVRSTLRPCGFFRALFRELLLVLDTLFGMTLLPVTFVMAFTHNRERIGDLLADTIVIRRPGSNLTSEPVPEQNPDGHESNKA
jgi:uncharacterized RDD family membrane protein YckC